MIRLSLVALLASCTQAPPAPGSQTFDIQDLDVGLVVSGALLAVDVNGDGHLDLVVAGSDSMSVRLNDGAGGFMPGRTVAAGANPSDIVAGDFDRDGHLDFLLANHETRYVSIIRGHVADLLSGPATPIPVDVGPHPHALAVADMDDDGLLDFLVDDRNAHALQIFRGQGDATFIRGRAIDVGGDPYRGMALHDLDQDGMLDVVTPNEGVVRVQMGNAEGEFGRSVDLRTAGLAPFRVAVGDFDGDGRPDIAAGGGENQGRVAVWSGSGDGTFTLAAGFPRDIGQGPASLAVGDFDGDGVDDLLAAAYMGDEVTILHGDGRSTPPVRIDTRGHPWGLAVGDFNGDGRTDFVVGHDGLTVVSLFISNPQR